MAALQDLIAQIEDPILRERIAKEADKLTKTKKFGLVFEEHIPECTPLYDMPVKKGCQIILRNRTEDKSIYTVLKIDDDQAVCFKKEEPDKTVIFNLKDIVRVAEFGEPIYPYLEPIDSVCNAPDSDLWHTLIEADNYHALQLLEYLYAGQVDCIYIDPPYNTGARDWKYNNDYVDSNDQYRHSKWLSMMEKRLKLAKKLLNPNDSVLIVTIDEKEYLHLGCLLEELFSEARIQMVSNMVNHAGVTRADSFSRTDEYIFFVMFGDACPESISLSENWKGQISHEGKKGIYWNSLQRTGPNELRKDRPNMFYPIFLSEDGKQIVEVGNPIPLNQNKDSVSAPKNTIAIWPTFPDGREGRWRLGREMLLSLIEKHYVKIGRFRGKHTHFSYLTHGEQIKVENGEFQITGYDDDGSIIVDDSKYEKRFIPGTQWSILSHDATQLGTKMLNTIISKRFTFPKSLYAVHDTIRFFVANKPNATIVDFFAGSGTTLHAVNLLNAEDNGHRQCIMVTNNEVSESEEKALTEQGFHQGDTEWEHYGIARYVTWPRTVCSIEGHDINGEPLKGNYGFETESYEPDDEVSVVSSTTKKPVKKIVYKKVKNQIYPKLTDIQMSDGFKANAAYFRLGFLDKTSVALGMQFKKMIPILWMKAGAVGPCPIVETDIPDMLILPENRFAVLNNEDAFSAFSEELDKYPEIQTVFLVTDYEANYRSMVKNLNVKTTYQLYRDYLDNFRINHGRD